MKKKTIQLSKLTLNKERITNLDKINGGDGSTVLTFCMCYTSDCHTVEQSVTCGATIESKDLQHCQTNKYVSDIHGGPCTGCNGVCK